MSGKSYLISTVASCAFKVRVKHARRCLYLSVSVYQPLPAVVTKVTCHYPKR